MNLKDSKISLNYTVALSDDKENVYDSYTLVNDVNLHDHSWNHTLIQGPKDKKIYFKEFKYGSAYETEHKDVHYQIEN